MTFNDFNFDERLLEGLDSMGFDTPTPIQEQAIPLILQNRDLIACAQTGTGKTAAYVLPLINKIIHTEHSHLNTLIIAPTRELAQQIDQQVEGFAYFTGVSSISVYGGGDGAAWEQQKRALRDGTDIVIATPGRLIAMLTQPGSPIKTDHLQHLVLDEADRMLDMGFYEDILRIISFLPQNRQTLLFSATMPPKIRALAGRILKDPEQVNIAISKPPEGILQQAYMAYDEQKTALLKHLLSTIPYDRVIIFASTKDKVKMLNRELLRSGLSIKAFHSDLEQQEREEIMREFRNKELHILIGTDILSRGIDVEGISLVVNYDVPPDPEDYVHRIGRTARAERTGTAITFINPADQRKFFTIENLIGKDIPKLKLPGELGEGPAYNPEARSKSGPKKPFKGKGRGGDAKRPGGPRPSRGGPRN